MSEKQLAASLFPVSDDRGTRKKGHATPKRKEAERKNFRPLVVSKKSMTREERKEAKARQKEQRDALYAKRRAALEGRGDPRYLPEQDRGPARKYLRDYIDARWSISEFLMPVMIILLAASLFLQPLQPTGLLPQILLIGMYLMIAVSVIEVIFVNRKLKKILKAKFGDAQSSRTGFYLFSRMISIRPWRSPRPTNKRGEFPE